MESESNCNEFPDVMEFSVIKEASELRTINGTGVMINAFPTMLPQRLPNAWPPGKQIVLP
jgi:hypothetical protein